MKINKIQDLDLSKYKLAYYEGNSLSSDRFSQDTVMKLAEIGESDEVYPLRVALIPKEVRLTECGGDDWEDGTADCNASGFYRYPEGTIFLKGKLGGELILVEGKDI